MKQMLTIVLCSLSMLAIAQPVTSDEVNYIISITNTANEPLKNQEITATNSNNLSEIHTKFTTAKGKIKFILRRGETYKFEYLDQSFTASIPLKSQSFLTKKIKYSGSIAMNKPTAFDTITFRKIPKAPSETEALFQLILKNKEGKIYKNLDVWLVQSTIKKVYYTKTSNKGYATFKLPIGYDYQVNFKYDENYRTISVPKQPQLRFRKGFTYVSSYMDIVETERNDTIFQKVPFTQKPTLKRALINVTVLDLDGNPLPDENVYLQGIDKVYTTTTDSSGRTALMLPKGKQYAVNFEYRENLEVLDIKEGNHTRKDNIRYKYIGSKAIKARIAERLRNQIRWDSLAKIQAFRDSLAIARSPYSNFMKQLYIWDKDSVFQHIKKRAELDLKNVTENPKYFEEVGDEAVAALYRNQAKWDDKLIITDLTCSMYPYLDQILSWHVLEINLRDTEKFENQYMFFNDGDGKMMSEKRTGKTGGFHYSNSAPKLENLTTVMRETMSTGCSGDGPENDLEALLNGVGQRKLKTMEIILIADNNSEIRDFELLKKLNVPIRVILAGTYWGANEQYLELAYHTKGSVHTLEEDLENLFELNDGEYIKIGEHRYRVNKGKFLKTSKM